MTHSRSARTLLLLIASVSLFPACDSLPLLAPTDSTITVVATQSVVPLGGETTISAVVTEPSGTAVQNGTLVTFSTTLGMLDPQEARTEDGRASVRLLADNVAGTATISAFSGTATSNSIQITIG